LLVNAADYTNSHVLVAMHAAPLRLRDGARCGILAAASYTNLLGASMPVAPRISIIIPVLNEERQIGALLQSLEQLPEPAEIIVVDGGSRDQTVVLARQYSSVQTAQAVQVLELGRASRAWQMNAGAAQARGDVLLFLHADVRLPQDACKTLAQAITASNAVGGCFSFGFPAGLPRLWYVYAWGINLRTRWFQTATGDQAIFVRRRVFEELGGYRDLPLMEDLELFKSLKRQGAVVILPLPVTVSPRRWQQRGLVRTGLLMYALRFGYWLGVDAARLKQFFLDVR
jgi:rSAM/selenodomain-associated transferase 2